MQVHVHKGASGRYALLADEGTELLPEEFGPWKKLGVMEINTGDPDRLGAPTEETLGNLQQHGCHFMQLSMSSE